MKQKITVSLIALVAFVALYSAYLYSQPIVPYGPNVLAALYQQKLTPAASSAAIQTAEQTFTVNGLITRDIVFVNGPAPTSLCPMVSARVSAANTLAIAFSTLTAAGCTPATGVYNIYAFRYGG